MNMAQALVTKTIEANPLTVFSKTYCGYCSRTKSLFNKMGAKPYIMELDERNDGAEIQKYLSQVTGGNTVPRVFVGGKFIGGCDDTHALYNSGKLQNLLKEAGVPFNQ
eukprot:TRINITY_DN3930_c0_g1_i1.p1 TRINITY_DN3930_c0_g1~~TRINITY_DN3930_c0_g1_i1.p1  ORF type:complete len:121 (-),score=32.63 TRINITY_DN3930_c0_g1_i1:52-375(-)